MGFYFWGRDNWYFHFDERFLNRRAIGGGQVGGGESDVGTGYFGPTELKQKVVTRRYIRNHFARLTDSKVSQGRWKECREKETWSYKSTEEACMGEALIYIPRRYE